ncbi:hypothetical protein LMIY3S_02374 [Labrys miyagiensis]
MWKVKEFSEAEARGYVHRFPSLIDPKRLPDRGATLAEAQRSRLENDKHDEADKSPIVGTHFLWDGDVLAEEAPLRLDGSVDWQKATRWHYEPVSFRPLAKETPEGDLLYIVTDHLGTPREMFDEKGAVCWVASYTTWGLVRGLKVAVPQAANDDYAGIGGTPGGSGGGRATFGNLALKPVAEDSLQAYACPIRFQGQWQDEETGLYYNRHRHYDPLAGQYISPDPVGLEGGDRPQGYAENPHLSYDPYGLKVRWVDENVGLQGTAKAYNDSAPGARSNVATKTGQAPAIERELPDGEKRLVKFDGVDNNIMVDRKIAVVTTPKAKIQALRQSEALRQNSLTGRWEVPTMAQQNRAIKMFQELNITNITTKIVP